MKRKSLPKNLRKQFEDLTKGSCHPVPDMAFIIGKINDESVIDGYINGQQLDSLEDILPCLCSTVIGAIHGIEQKKTVQKSVLSFIKRYKLDD